MTKTARREYKREIDRARNNLAWSVSHLLRVFEAYQENYPQIAEPLGQVLIALASIDDTLEIIDERI